MSAPAVEAHDVFCLYATPRGHVAALRGLSLEVAQGERLVVHGPNGSGKTTLLRVLSGERSPSAGAVRVAGVDLVGADAAERAALLSRHVGLVDQHHPRTLRPELDVVDNVALQLRVCGHSAAAARVAAQASLESMGLGALGSRRPQTLSGGEAQRVAVCAALVHRPSVLLADEPTGELDRVAADGVYDLLVDATREVGATLVLVTHDVGAARVADRVVRIRDGRLSEEWQPGAVGGETLVVDDRGWVRLPEPLRRAVGLARGVRARRTEGGILLSTGAPLAPRPVGEPAAPVSGGATRTPPARVGDAPPPVARMHRVRVERAPALRGLTLDLEAGRLVVLQGPSGSGKTTLLRVLTGLERPDDGSVVVAGTDLSTLDRSALARLRNRHVAVSGQSTGLVDTLDVAGNLELARDARGLPADDAVVGGWVDALGLHGLRQRPAAVLSGGERQRVAVARTLAAEPDLAVLDEPTSQQDEANAEQVVAALVRAARAGVAVVVATHDPVLVAAADLVVRLG